MTVGRGDERRGNIDPAPQPPKHEGTWMSDEQVEGDEMAGAIIVAYLLPNSHGC